MTRTFQQILTAFLALATSVSVHAELNKFYRVATESPSTILDLSPDGVLSWSNSVMTGTFEIQRSLTLETPDWAPWTRGTFSNHLSSIQVFHPSPPTGMQFIPGGQFTMGDILRDLSNARSVHQAYVSPFFMATFEITTQDVRDTYQWAFDQGLLLVTTNSVRLSHGTNTLLMPLRAFSQEIQFAEGRFSVRANRTNHPVSFVNWYGAVAYCNFRGMMEGRDLCYDLETWSCDFSKVGYRLPTESEWEFACRGGYEGLRFPWPDSPFIDHSRANYRSSTNNFYDISPTRGFHPDFANSRPRSSPVGTFAPNQYGLYDMIGNVWEWCWDWAARYPSGSHVNRTGPEPDDTLRFRIFRGGAWFTTAERVTNASRYTSATPTATVEDVGFRVIIPYRPNPQPDP